MKKLNALYFLLFILLVMGAFASMAQNSYGLKIMGGVSFVFGLLFIVEFISLIRKEEKKDLFLLAELLGLATIAVLFGLRIFYIHFNNVELLFTAAAILLMGIYLRKMLIRYNYFKEKSKLLAILMIIFHLSIALFLLSLALVPFTATTAEYAGIGAFVLLLFFLVIGFLKKNMLMEGEKISAFTMVARFKDHSIIIASLIIMFSFYVGFNKIGILPGIYSDEFPKAYFELVNKATSNKEKPVDGKYKFEEFKKQYDQFMRQNRLRDN